MVKTDMVVKDGTIMTTDYYPACVRKFGFFFLFAFFWPFVLFCFPEIFMCMVYSQYKINLLFPMQVLKMPYLSDSSEWELKVRWYKKRKDNKTLDKYELMSGTYITLMNIIEDYWILLKMNMNIDCYWILLNIIWISKYDYYWIIIDYYCLSLIQSGQAKDLFAVVYWEQSYVRWSYRLLDRTKKGKQFFR